MVLAGEIIYADDVNAITTRVGCRLRRAANQSINNNTVTSISWDTEDEDTDGFIAVTSTTVTIPSGKDGVYAITLVTTPAALAAATRVASFINLANGTGTLPTGVPTSFRALSNLTEEAITLAIVQPLVAGNTIICQTIHNEGAAVNYTAALSVYRVAI